MKVLVPLHPKPTSESFEIQEADKMDESEDSTLPEKDEPEDDEDETIL